MQVIGADHLFHCGFSLDGFLRFYHSRRRQHPNKSFCFSYKVKDENVSSLGIVCCANEQAEATQFLEKPSASAVEELKKKETIITACPCVYVFRHSALEHIQTFAKNWKAYLQPATSTSTTTATTTASDDTEETKDDTDESTTASTAAAAVVTVEDECSISPQRHTKVTKPSMGHLLEYLINPIKGEGSTTQRRHGFFAMRLPSGFRLIGGSIGITDYKNMNDTFAQWEGVEDSGSEVEVSWCSQNLNRGFSFKGVSQYAEGDLRGTITRSLTL